MAENKNGVAIVSEHGAKLVEVLEMAKGWGRTIRMAALGIGILVSSYLVPKWTLENHDKAKAEEAQQQISPAALPVGGGTVPTTVPAAVPNQSSVTFLVQSYGQNRSGRKFLNSLADYKQPGNQVVVLEGTAARLDVANMKGRTITAYGRTSQYKGQPQIVVSDPSGIQVR